MDRVRACTVALLACVASTTVAAQVVPAEFPAEIAHGEGLVEPGITTPTLELSFPFSPGSFEVTVQRRERRSPSHDWVMRTRTESTSYIMTAVSARRGGEVLFVAGMKADGTSIVERWEYDYPDGRHVSTFIDPDPAPPTAIPSRFRPTTMVRGCDWRPLRGIPAPRKTVVYEGPDGPFTALEADPEGRFLLLYDYSLKSLRRVLSVAPSVLETLYTARDHPQLVEVGSIEARDRTSGERVFVVWKVMPRKRPLAEDVFTLLIDEDNDTELDSIETFSYAAYKESRYWSSSGWIFLWQAG